MPQDDCSSIIQYHYLQITGLAAILGPPFPSSRPFDQRASDSLISSWQNLLDHFIKLTRLLREQHIRMRFFNYYVFMLGIYLCFAEGNDDIQIVSEKLQDVTDLLSSLDGSQDLLFLMKEQSRRVMRQERQSDPSSVIPATFPLLAASTTIPDGSQELQSDECAAGTPKSTSASMLDLTAQRGGPVCLVHTAIDMITRAAPDDIVSGQEGYFDEITSSDLDELAKQFCWGTEVHLELENNWLYDS